MAPTDDLVWCSLCVLLALSCHCHLYLYLFMFRRILVLVTVWLWFAITTITASHYHHQYCGIEQYHHYRSCLLLQPPPTISRRMAAAISGMNCKKKSRHNVKHAKKGNNKKGKVDTYVFILFFLFLFLDTELTLFYQTQLPMSSFFSHSFADWYLLQNKQRADNDLAKQRSIGGHCSSLCNSEWPAYRVQCRCKRSAK